MSKDYCTILIGKGDSDFKTAMLLMKADPSLHEQRDSYPAGYREISESISNLAAH